MIEVRCSMVISPNGFIARPDGDEGWVSEESWQDFIRDAEEANNFIVGRKTYESVMANYGNENFSVIKARHKIVITHDTRFKPDGSFTAMRNPQEAIGFLRQQPDVHEILLAGGGELNAAFAKDGLIDVLELVVEPHLIGAGRPVFGVGDYELKLKLQEVHSLSNERARLIYSVQKQQ